MQRKSFLAILFFLIAGTLVSTVGRRDPDISLSAIGEMWNDVLRDTDQVGMKLTRLSDADEMRIGREVSQHVPRAFPVGSADSIYLNDVGDALLKGIQRPGIQYVFHIVEMPEINAFALPGGQIYVTTGMMAFVQSEAELAAVLGHEISHVDLRHCVEHYQYQETLRKAGAGGAGWMVELAHRLITMGFTQDQERDADSNGLRLAIAAGYQPEAAAQLFERMSAHTGEAPAPPANTPDGEVRQATIGALQAYFRTHPTSLDRSRRLQDLVDKNSGQFVGKTFYVGKQNLQQKVAKSKQEFPAEFERK
jgi:predicted Zn-dependent protease